MTLGPCLRPEFVRWNDVFRAAARACHAPPNEWIVGAALVVIANGGTAPDQISFGYLVNPHKNHVISTPRCIGSGLVGSLRAVEEGHINVYGVAS